MTEYSQYRKESASDYERVECIVHMSKDHCEVFVKKIFFKKTQTNNYQRNIERQVRTSESTTLEKG